MNYKVNKEDNGDLDYEK